MAMLRGNHKAKTKKAGYSIQSDSVSGYFYTSYRKLRRWKRGRNECDDNRASTEREFMLSQWCSDHEHNEPGGQTDAI